MSDNAIETLQFNCTTCPSECLLTVKVERDANGAVVEVRSVTGNNCPRGDKFAHQELTCPMRVLTTTVGRIRRRRGAAARAHGRSHPARTPCPGDGPHPRPSRRRPHPHGDVVQEDLLGTNIDLVASMNIDPT